MIAEAFLQEIAEYVDSRVGKVVLNGNYEITQFEVKEVTDNTLAMNYVVPVSDVSLITSIELRDNAGQTITENAVHVPISADTLILQTIEVKEVI